MATLLAAGNGKYAGTLVVEHRFNPDACPARSGTGGSDRTGEMCHNAPRCVFQISNFKYEQLRPAGYVGHVYNVPGTMESCPTYFCLSPYAEPIHCFMERSSG